MATSALEVVNAVPIHKISVQSTSGVKKMHTMLPLCTERHVLYPDPMSYSDPDKYCYRFLQHSVTSDSAYYSHSSNSNAVLGGSLQRPHKSRKKEVGPIHLESLMLASQTRYVLNQHEPLNPRLVNSSNNNERKEAPVLRLRTDAMSSSGLYTAIKKHDPTQPSTSKTTTAATPTAIPIPPNLIRTVNAPPKTTYTKLKLFLKLNDADFTNPKIDFEEESGLDAEPQFVFTVGSSRIHSDQAYHQIFPATTSQTELCADCLPEVLQTVMNGHDASFMYFGAISRIKQDLLYSRSPQSPLSNGVYVTTIQWLFRLIDEYRLKKKDVRYSIRVSALHYSQKNDQLIDLLSDVCNDAGADSSVKCVEDPSFGVTVENRSEVRVETVDQALFYLDRVYDHRVTEEDEVQRSSHTFFYLTIYRYKSNGEVLESGKSRLCLIDLGLGEKNSKSGFMTMPVLGNILLTIFQGQKHLPSRQNTLCKLLKESVGSARNKSTAVLSTFAPVEGRCLVETENLVQLATKMHKVVRKNVGSPGSRRSFNLKSETSTVNGSPVMQNHVNYQDPQPRHQLLQQQMQQQQHPLVDPLEYNSSSEQSCAETVIFLGPANGVQPTGTGYNGCSTLPPIPGSPLKRKSSSSKGSHHSGGRKSNYSIHSMTPEPLPPPQIIPIDCPPNAVVHSSASLHSLSLTSSPKRPTHLFQKSSGSMPGTPVQNRSARQSSVPTDLILCNPMAVNNSNEKLNGSLKRSKKQCANQLDEDFFNIDPDKRDMVLHWVMEQKVEYGADICGIGKPFPADYIGVVEKYITSVPNKVDSCIQCNEEDIDLELLNVWNQARFLDDIVEDDEEPSTASANKPSPSRSHHHGHTREALAERAPPLSILSKESDILGDLRMLPLERMNSVAAEEDEEENDENVEMTDEELEKAMAASISSIKSHEILSKLRTDFPPEMEMQDSFAPSMMTSGTDTKPPTEGDFYRRASHLEAYASERLKELRLKDAEKRDFIKTGTDRIKQMLNCVDPNTTSFHSENTRKSGLSATLNPPSPKLVSPPAPKKKEQGSSLMDKLKLKQLTCCNAMTTSVASSTSIGTNTIHSSLATNPFKTVKVSSTKPMRTLSPMKESRESKEPSIISPLPPELAKQITDQLKSAGLGKASSLPVPIGHSSSSSPVRTAPRSRKDSDPPKKPVKTKSTKERRSSVEAAATTTAVPPSPYSKMTTAKMIGGTYSSGHGSDETSSIPGQAKSGQSSGTNVAMPHVSNGALGGKNRPRNRESFSASSGYESADYGRYKVAMQSPSPHGAGPTGVIAAKKGAAGALIVVQKEVASLRNLRDSLALQLGESLKMLGMPDQVVLEEDSTYTGLSPEVTVELLKQETRQLEKRLNVCRSKTMIVTTFL